MNTSSIALQPNLVERVHQIVKDKGDTVEEFVNQAVRERLEQLEDQKLKAETQAFERLHPKLVQQYLGQFVAIHEGQVVDVDADFGTLFLRMQKQLGDIVVLIRQVRTEPVLELRAPSPRLERNVK
jgi:predicted DNA-binding protein